MENKIRCKKKTEGRMSCEDVLRHGRKLEKILAHKTVDEHNFSVCIDVLQSLQKVPMTLELLKSTHIGITVNKYRKIMIEKDGALNTKGIQLAKELIKSWKNLLLDNKQEPNISSTPSSLSSSSSKTSEHKSSLSSSSKQVNRHRHNPDQRDRHNPDRLHRTETMHSCQKISPKFCDGFELKNPPGSFRPKILKPQELKDRPVIETGQHSTIGNLGPHSGNESSQPMKATFEPLFASSSREQLKLNIVTGPHCTSDQFKRLKTKSASEGECTSSVEPAGFCDTSSSKDSHVSVKQAITQSCEANSLVPVQRTTASSSGVECNISVKQTIDAVRLKCRGMLAAALGTDEVMKKGIREGEKEAERRVDEEGESEGVDRELLACALEECIFEEFNNTDAKYRNRVRSRITNLRDAKNPLLRDSLLLGHISPRQMASMSSDDMASESMKALRAQLTKEAIHDHHLPTIAAAKSDLFRCSRCGIRDTTYNQVQTLSGDEPMTTFVVCNNCGNRWRFN